MRETSLLILLLTVSALGNIYLATQIFDMAIEVETYYSAYDELLIEYDHCASNGAKNDRSN